MNTQFLWHERNAVRAILGLLNFRVFGLGARGRDGGRQIVSRDAGDLEGQTALAADFRLRHGVAIAFDALRLRVGPLAGDLDGERRAGDVVVGKLQIHDVVAGLGWPVRDVQCTVLVVLALDLRFARSFNRQR